MNARTRQQLTVLGLIVGFSLAPHAIAAADQPQPAPAPRAEGRRIGIQGFGIAGINWPVAKESFEAAGLDENSIEFGGGAQVTDIWRALFVELSASRWSNAGERVFVDASGNRFPLGIPLDVKATHIDATVGWRLRGEGVSTYFGAGGGAVSYVEESPFALSGDDLDTRATSYHVLAGVEVPLKNWLAVSGEFRYRFIPDLLGDGGVSAVLDEDRFGGPHLGLGLRLTFGGPPEVVKRPAPPRPAPPPEPTPPRDPLTRRPGVNVGVITERAPVFLLPDATRKPLRILEPGTTLRILQQSGDWVRVEFQDTQFGPRQGYVQLKYVRVSKEPSPRP